VNGNWTYTYDPFKRLLGANQNSGQSVYSYDYDRYGNRWHQNGPHTMMLTLSGNNNRMDGYSYDAAGNLLNDGTTAYTFDAENRIISAVNSTSGTSAYVYDANGQRVRKTTAAAGSVDFLYDLAGREVAEVSSTGAWNRGEVLCSWPPSSHILGLAPRTSSTLTGSAPSGHGLQSRAQCMRPAPASPSAIGSPAPEATPLPCTSPPKNATPNPASTTSEKGISAHRSEGSCVPIPQVSPATS